MLLEQENWFMGYGQLLADCRRGEGGGQQQVLILCNADVDALAAARILTYMLRNDAVSYQILPCRTYSQLQERLAAVTDATSTSAIVLLNLGATRNLTSVVPSEGRTTIYVMDCRRPVHLANIHSETHIVVFGDNRVQLEQEIPSDGDNLSGMDSTTTEEDSFDDDDDDDDEEDEIALVMKEKTSFMETMAMAGIASTVTRSTKTLPYEETRRRTRMR
jgi:cell division control protein 45